MKRIAQNLLLLAGAMLVTVLVTELALRLFIPYRLSEVVEYHTDAYVGIRPVESRRYRLSEGGTCSVNAQGFRGAEDFTVEKPPGVVRVLTLGGSSTFCYHSDDAEVWPRVLEKRLRDHYGPHVQVINAGVPGYSSFDSRNNYVYQLRRLDPDMIVVYHSWNDIKYFRRVEREGMAIRGAWRPPSLARTIARRTQIGHRIRSFLHTYVIPARRENSMSAENVNIAEGGTAHQWERANFDDIALLAKADGVLPVFLSQASLLVDSTVTHPDARSHSYVEYAGLSFEETVAQWNKTTGIIRSSADAHNIPFIDVRSQIPSNLETFLDHVHLTPRGNALVADAVARGFIVSAAVDSVLSRPAP